MAKVLVRTQAQDFDLAAEIDALKGEDTDIGAITAFIGLCRDEQGSLSALELEHYPGMAEEEIMRISQEAVDRFQLRGLSVIHRFGRIEPGENIVLVITASRHRQASFDGANFLMDFLKTRAPFWKKEHLSGGNAGTWVDARDADDQALEKWTD